MRLRIQTLTFMLLALLAMACTNQKKQPAKAPVAIQPLKEQIVGAWFTEGSSEQLDDNLMTGYGQRLELNSDGTFKLEALMSVSGEVPYGITSVPAIAEFGAEIKGTYAIKGNTLSLTYNSDSVVAHMDPDNITIDDQSYSDHKTVTDIRQVMIERLESFGINKKMLEHSLRESVHGKTDSFTDVKTNGAELRMKFDGEEIVYYWEDC